MAGGGGSLEEPCFLPSLHFRVHTAPLSTVSRGQGKSWDFPSADRETEAPSDCDGPVRGWVSRPHPVPSGCPGVALSCPSIKLQPQAQG